MLRKPLKNYAGHLSGGPATWGPPTSDQEYLDDAQEVLVNMVNDAWK